MFAPTKTWRRWHRKISVNQRRYAMVSALAASAVPALVMSRGHRIERVPEVPLVIDTKVVSNLDKTKNVVAFLKGLNAFDDIEKSKNSRHVRRGVGKMRNRRYVQRRGPLVIFNEKGSLDRVVRNLPGVELAHVSRLNLLQLAPGGHLGRFCIWTKDAFERLDALYGSQRKAATEKSGYTLPRPLLNNADLARIINSDEVQSSLREKIPVKKIHIRKKNPLKNLGFLVKLNPHATTVKRRELLAKEARQKKKNAILEAKRKGTPVAQTPADKKKAEQKKAFTKKIRKQNKKFVSQLLA